MSFINIIKGSYRGEEVSGVYPMLSPWKEGAKGGFVRLRGDVGLKRRGEVIYNPRINIEPGMYFYCDAEGNAIGDTPTPVASTAVASASPYVITPTAVDYEQVFIRTETDEEAMERIRHTFEMLDRVADSVAQGKVRGLVVSGPPGIGKSFGVEAQLRVANEFRTIAGKDAEYEIVSGSAGGIGLYKKLYYNRKKGFVTVFDDCDGVLFDEDCLNLLKSALNSGERRRLSWNFESRVLAQEDIPNAFDFEGSIIFLTNVDFERVRAGRISDHLKAIVSRCHYLDLELGTMRDKLLRIRQIVNDGILFKDFGFTNYEEAQIVDWVYDNAEFLREVSLRMVKKVADLYASDKNTWKEFAEATCLKREAKFKRLLEHKKQHQEAEADIEE